jgi:hypothetical protein
LAAASKVVSGVIVTTRRVMKSSTRMFALRLGLIYQRLFDDVHRLAESERDGRCQVNRGL